MLKHALFVTTTFALGAGPISAQAAATCPVARSGAVVIYGDVTSNVTITAADLAALPRISVKGTAHDGAVSEYTGVPLHHLLARAGLPGGAQIRGAEMSRYIVVEAADAYRALFALAELDPAYRNPVAILADTKDGKPLDAQTGPFQVVSPGEQRHARWVRQVVCIRSARDQNP
jgi:hypothetical protein